MASLKDMRFIIHDVLDTEGHLASLGVDASCDRAFIDAVLDEAFKFTDGELKPLNASGDREGCTLKDGVVTTPAGFREAYRGYIAGGWAGLVGPTEYGGQALPPTFGLMLEELICTANMAFAMYPGLSRGCMHALIAHGSEAQKQHFLTRLLTGEWTGTMCLTEPHAGSDVGLARTKAEPRADGTWSITGTKIFISAGEHDLSDNIVHLVLARTEGAPAGTRGISMFVVPKIDLDGSRNSVVCGAIEEKMGIHGNATCVLNFDAAHGYLVGEENAGMKYMFTMMNTARLGVGLQGVCLAQRGFEASSGYARERLQMRSLTGPKAPDKPADPILVHPDVRRMLMAQRAFIEGGRALCYYANQCVDILEMGADAERRQRAGELLDFLTPIVKGFLTEWGFTSVNEAVQIFGGHGFIRETGVEQYVRDSRITLIYEGTTQIQGLDLLARKVMMTQGKGLTHFIGEMQQAAAECRAELPELATTLEAIIAEWPALSMQIGAKAMANPDEVGAASVDYLFYSGYAVLATMWARMAVTARRRLAEGVDDAYFAAKIDLARYYHARIVPKMAGHKAAMLTGSDNLMQVNDAVFTAD
ncbi:MAG: acyl-CoA dehydrogenase C-terminal domain-containing protein [Pseudomonadales bacterium]